MADEQYVADLEERVETLEGLLGNEPMSAVRCLRTCMARVQGVAERRFNSRIAVRGSPTGHGVCIDLCFRDTVDETYLVHWEHCAFEHTIEASLETSIERNRRKNKSHE